MTGRAISLLLSAVLLALAAAPAQPQSGSTGTITVGSGPHKGDYNFAPTETCFIASFGKKPPGLSVVMSSEQSSLSIDMPNIDPKHANEIQVVLVIADGRGGKGTSSVTYEIDTRPDSVLEPFQKAERANKGMSGKATTTLMHKGGSALLSFSGETASGIKLDGSVTCRTMT
ncbi:MAG TPA: hypothetical protein VFO82_09840 [Steroidobacteraceae bacterium]|nr:hypothetical protein [Steroidobacteraceae bacterium]